MISDTAIKVTGISKSYQIGSVLERSDTLRDLISTNIERAVQMFSAKNRAEKKEENTIWALKDISFELKKGKVLGIIGRNGAGKSTLLKILSRVTDPTEGNGEIHGRVGSLLEVGTGFHPELTGRENIYLNGAILGMHRHEITKKFDEIVAFSEVEKFIDTPVKRYSSGMYLRLAFAVAAHLEPEILVVDEVLAVGDAEFQAKCIGKMGDVAQQGRTVLFVSHNMSAILRLTQEAIVLNKGKIIMRGDTPEAVDYYLNFGMSKLGERIWDEDEIPANSKPFKPLSVKILDNNNNVVDTVRSIEGFNIEIEYCLEEQITGLRVGLYMMTTRGEPVFTTFDTDKPERFREYTSRGKGIYVSRCHIPANLLNGGRFVIGINASSYKIKRYFQDEKVLTFNVDITGAPGTQWPEPRVGAIRPKLEWEIQHYGN